MDNRTLTAIVLSLALWYAWMVFFAPPPPAMDADGVPDSDGAVAATAPTTQAPSPPQDAPAVAAVTGPEQTVQVDLCGAEATVSNRTGSVAPLSLRGHEARYDIQPAWSWLWSVATGAADEWKPYGDDPGPVVLFTEQAQAFVGGAGDASTAPGPVQVVSSEPQQLDTRRVVDGRIEITRTLRAVVGDPCRAELVMTWRNGGSQPWTRGLWVGVHDVFAEHVSRYDLSPRPVALLDGYLETWDDLEDAPSPAAIEGEVGAFGVAGHYFAAVAVPTVTTGRLWYGAVPGPQGAPMHGVHWVDDAPLAAGESRTATFTLYFGPKESDALTAVDDDLSSLISLGWLSFLARPLLWLLKQIHGAVGNWGIAIILLVFLVKAVFFRLTQSAFASSQAMQAVQPQMKALQEEFKDNPEELNRRMLALFSDNGVNPLGGCLPMLVQMPVWFALYSVLLSAVELYHTEFLYLRDLSQPDPYMVSPALVMAIMFGQQQLMPTGNLDPAQARLMKLMPLIFGLLFFSFPSGLVVYVFVNTLLSMLQQLYIKRTFKPKVPAAAGTGGA